MVILKDFKQPRLQECVFFAFVSRHSPQKRPTSTHMVRFILLNSRISINKKKLWSKCVTALSSINIHRINGHSLRFIVPSLEAVSEIRKPDTAGYFTPQISYNSVNTSG